MFTRSISSSMNPANLKLHAHYLARLRLELIADGAFKEGDPMDKALLKLIDRCQTAE